MEFAGTLPFEVPEEPAVVEGTVHQTALVSRAFWLLGTVEARGEKSTENKKPLFPAEFSIAIC